MGNSESNNSLPISSPNFSPHCDVVSRVNSPYYGDVKIVKDLRTGEQMILKDVTAYSEEAYVEELKFYDQRVKKTHPNIVRIFGYTSQDKQNFCSTLYKISIYIETNARDLATELDDRINTRNNYTESDLLLVIENLVSGLAYFQTNESAHKDIRPFNIFVTEGQTYKLSDPGLHPQRATGLSNAILNVAKSLLAPELISEVPTQNFDVKYDETKADVYSFGITALALATLTNPEEFYDYTEGKIKTELLAEKLEQVRVSYSYFTFELIRDSLAGTAEERPDFILLSNRLAPYQDDIRRRAPLPFFKEASPQKEEQGERPVQPTDDLVLEVEPADQEVTKKAGRKVHSGNNEEAPQGEQQNNFVDEALQRASEQLAKSQQLRAESNGTETNTYTGANYNYSPLADLDDLDARIKAALARSQETFKQIFANDGSLANNYYSSNYTPATTTENAQSTYTSGYIPTYDYNVTYPTQQQQQPVVQEVIQEEVRQENVEAPVKEEVVVEQPVVTQQQQEVPTMEASTTVVENAEHQQKQPEPILQVEVGNVNIAVGEQGVTVEKKEEEVAAQ